MTLMEYVSTERASHVDATPKKTVMNPLLVILNYVWLRLVTLEMTSENPIKKSPTQINNPTMFVVMKITPFYTHTFDLIFLTSP